MAVEKMEMLNIIGQMNKVDEIAKKIILSSSVHMVNALSEVQQNSFPILKAQENVDALIDYNYIKQYISQKNLKDTENKLQAIASIIDLKQKIDLKYVKQDYDFKLNELKISEYYEMVRERHEKLQKLEKEEESIVQLRQNLEYIKDIKVNLNELLDLNYIKVKMGKISKINMEKLKENYENISAIVFKVYQEKESVVIIAFIPKPIEIEVDRVLNSLNFEEYIIDLKFNGTPLEWVKQINEKIIQINKEKNLIKNELLDFKKDKSKEIQMYYSRLMMEYKVEEFKNNIACTNEFFYLTGWISSCKVQILDDMLKCYGNELVVIFKGTDELREGQQPPTNLKNNAFVRPFEALVNMYGTPSYKELDPSIFVGLSYMLLFGAMFGDVGQGLIFVIVGILLTKSFHRPNLGGVLSRMGISSTIFGFIYGSVFGFDNILTYGGLKLPFNPMENINTILISALAIGVFLMSTGILYNIANGIKNKDYESGLFSRNGVAGLLFYWMVLYIVASLVLGKSLILPMPVLVTVCVILLLVTLFKQPIASLVTGVRPLYKESKSDYYVENGFGIFETILTFFSNTVSFIRVGSFAINHVGLFIAFKTLGEMAGNPAGNAVALIFGNIIIIGLEGLIVFIQGLRLEYYELFSKYYSGEGYQYEPFHLKNTYNQEKNQKLNFKNKKNLLVTIE